MAGKAQRTFTGYHMAAILIAFFAVVIVVNLVMARLAARTFGGVVVENSYVASQHFNRWLDEASRERALGWQAEAKRTSDDRVSVVLTGVPAQGLALSGDARHPLGRLPDRTLGFTRQADGSWLSDKSLPAGRWRLRLELDAAGQQWRSEADLR